MVQRGEGPQRIEPVMDIQTQAEIILRSAEYDTWTWGGLPHTVVCFENAALAGFVHVFASGEELLAEWRGAQQTTLSRHSAALRAAGNKAWNVYSVLLSEAEAVPEIARAVERIEEDFTLTRKIARLGVTTRDALEHALMALTKVAAKPDLEEAQFAMRLRMRLSDVPERALTAFLGETPAQELARMLGEPK